MIDNLPVATQSSPVASVVASSGQANSSGPAASLGHDDNNSSTVTCTVPPTSFANTLQSRLKLMAIHKTAPQIVAIETTTNQKIKQPELPDSFTSAALEAASTGTINTDRADTVSGKAKPEDDSPSQTASTPAMPDPIVPVPLALNTVIPSLLPAPTGVAPASTPAPDPSAVKESTSRGTALASASDMPVDPASTAILAAMPEKTDGLAANSGSKSSDASFADTLRNSTASTGINPAQTPMQATSLATTVPVKDVATPIVSAHWASDVGNQLRWMVNQRESRADLVLNPPQLGRIEVSISLNGDQASASFVSANPEVRDALQGSLPRLREVLADAGVFLGQANIGAESFRHGGNGSEKGGKSPDDSFSPAGSSLLGSINGPLPLAAAARQVGRGAGLVDLFA